LDVANIIIEQPELQMVGIYNGDFDALIDTLEHIHAVPLHIPRPTLFAFERDTALPIYNEMAIYPAFCADGGYPWRAITDSVDRDIARDILLDRSSLGSIYIYLKDFSDMAFVYRLVEEMIKIFPEISTVNFLLQHLPQTASHLEPITEFEADF
jgi:hypothetical protein